MNEEIEKRKIEVNKHITLIREARIRESGKRASSYLYVSSGALVLSISFLNIFNFERLENPWILTCAWLALLGAIVMHLVSYNLTDFSFSKQETDITNWIKGGMKLDSVPSDSNGWTKMVRYMNIIGSIGTIVGLVLMSMFAIINLHKFNMNNEENKIIRGDNQNNVGQKQSEPTIAGPSLQDRLDQNTSDQNSTSTNTSNEKEEEN